jgi:hypothetical protein
MIQQMESIGYIVSEVTILLFVLFLGVGIVALRRKLYGRPAFTQRDRKLFFGHSRREISLFALGKAAILFSFFAAVEFVVLAPFGAAVLSVIMLVTLLAVVRFTLM